MGCGITDVIPRFSRGGADHLIVSEKPLASFLARLAALFSIKVFIGFFLFCFLLSLPLLMLATPYDCV